MSNSEPRHDDNDKIDRVWGNIWINDDIVYADSYANGAIIHPDDGGTQNVLGLIAGGSVIIANTRPNGARGQLYGSGIKINAAIMAMYGGFISHYWQNTLTAYHDWNDNLSYGYIADGSGGHMNNFRAQYQNLSQFQRGRWLCLLLHHVKGQQQLRMDLLQSLLINQLLQLDE